MKTFNATLSRIAILVSIFLFAATSSFGSGKEAKRAMSVYTVNISVDNYIDDANNRSFEDAVLAVNNGNYDRIEFAQSLSTIQISEGLSALTENVTIDGTRSGSGRIKFVPLGNIDNTAPCTSSVARSTLMKLAGPTTNSYTIKGIYFDHCYSHNMIDILSQDINVLFENCKFNTEGVNCYNSIGGVSDGFSSEVNIAGAIKISTGCALTINNSEIYYPFYGYTGGLQDGKTFIYSKNPSIPPSQSSIQLIKISNSTIIGGFLSSQIASLTINNLELINNKMIIDNLVHLQNPGYTAPRKYIYVNAKNLTLAGCTLAMESAYLRERQGASITFSNVESGRVSNNHIGGKWHMGNSIFDKDISYFQLLLYMNPLTTTNSKLFVDSNSFIRIYNTAITNPTTLLVDEKIVNSNNAPREVYNNFRISLDGNGNESNYKPVIYFRSNRFNYDENMRKKLIVDNGEYITSVPKNGSISFTNFSNTRISKIYFDDNIVNRVERVCSFYDIDTICLRNNYFGVDPSPSSPDDIGIFNPTQPVLITRWMKDGGVFSKFTKVDISGNKFAGVPRNIVNGNGWQAPDLHFVAVRFQGKSIIKNNLFASTLNASNVRMGSLGILFQSTAGFSSGSGNEKNATVLIGDETEGGKNQFVKAEPGTNSILSGGVSITDYEMPGEGNSHNYTNYISIGLNDFKSAIGSDPTLFKGVRLQQTTNLQQLDSEYFKTKYGHGGNSFCAGSRPAPVISKIERHVNDITKIKVTYFSVLNDEVDFYFANFPYQAEKRLLRTKIISGSQVEDDDYKCGNASLPLRSSYVDLQLPTNAGAPGSYSINALATYPVEYPNGKYRGSQTSEFSNPYIDGTISGLDTTCEPTATFTFNRSEFSPTPTNNVHLYNYQWFNFIDNDNDNKISYGDVLTAIAGATNSTFTATNLAFGSHKFALVVTYEYGTGTLKSTVEKKFPTQVTRVENLLASVSLSSDPNPLTCLDPNTSIIFTANPTHGGLNPSYLFTRNGSTISSGSSNSLTLNSGQWQSGDVIEVTMTSSLSCASPQIVQDRKTLIGKDSIIINQQPVGDTVCVGESVTLSVGATTLNGSTLSYQWQELINGIWTSVPAPEGVAEDFWVTSQVKYTGIYRVVVSITGCSSTTPIEITSDAVYVKFIQPTKPRIIATCNTLCDSSMASGETRRWRLRTQVGSYILDDTTKCIDIDSCGKYVVCHLIGNCETCSDTVVVSVPDPIGLQALVRPANFEGLSTIYPNPTSAEVTMKFEPVVTIFNQQGRVVKRIENPEFTRTGFNMNLSDLPSGIYMVQTVMGSHVIKDKVVVNR